VDLSVIILNHNTRDMTVACIESVYRETRLSKFEVLLVDNASIDGSVEAVRERFPDVICKINTENVVFPIANNDALPLTRGRLVLLLNSDTVILDGALDKMVAFMDATPSAGVCGAKMYDAQLQPWRYETWTLSGARYLMHPLLLKLFGNIGDRNVDWVCGACLLIRRGVIDQIGPMDSFMYGEDMDWCLRAKAAGWEVWHLGSAKIIHYWGVTGTTPQKIAWRIYAGRRSKVYYIGKHGGALGALSIRLALLIEAFAKLVFYSLESPFLDRDARAFRFGQCRGYWRLTKNILARRILEPMPTRR
jgi:GT2 family glycosyltransferase